MEDMTFIDTHCHLSDGAFAGEEDSYIQRAKEAGVEIMLQPDVDSRERQSMFDVTGRHPGVLFPMLGLYPGSVDKEWKKEIGRMLEYSDKKVVAIGEIGLDYYYGKEFEKEQREALHWQLDYAKERDLPVNIHLRDAMGDFLEILRSHKGLRGNMHAYSGSYESFMELQRLGDWSIGVGGVVTFKKASLAEVVAKVPLERIVLETDAPYLTPVPYRGRRNESSYIPFIAAKVAELKGISAEEVLRVTEENTRRVFGI